MGRRGVLFLAAIVLLANLPSSSLAAFVNFESHQIHPIGMSPDGSKLAALNTPDGYLVIYELSIVTGPTMTAQIPVGMEPVSLTWHGNNEIWVANHLSDAISIVNVTTGNVVKTLLVGDEPTDVVFAGAPERAFVCVSQEDAVKVYDPANLAAAPIVIPIFGSDPRALATSPDRSKVYVSVFESGNRSTILPETTVVNGGGQPPANPPMDPMLPPAPNTGLIVQKSGANWVDDTGGIWNSHVTWSLPDNDIVQISTNTMTVTANFTGVGTLNYDLEVNPSSGVIYVSNHESLNLTRFENNLQDNFARMRVTIINPLGPTITPIHLNPHINYAVVPGPQSEMDQSLSLPTDMVWNSSGTLLYMAAMGSGKVAVLTPGGTVVDRWDVADGPTGLALDENRGRLYVLDRFAEKIRCVSLSTGTVVQLAGLGFNPEPPEVQNGRKFLYDARLSSGHGDVSCATCHPFANFDGLAWDLGRPDGAYLSAPDGQLDTLLVGFHPMKGPMVTQSLRGLRDTAPYHQRGDRGDLFEFNVAFPDLMGRASGLDGADMSAFNDFIQTVTYPPNPNQNLDRTLPNPTLQPSPQRGRNAFTTLHLDDGKFCVECHEFPAGTNNQITSATVMGNTQDLNISQLRNLYEKTGYGRTGALKNGFGFTHNGQWETLFEFFKQPFFTFGSNLVRRDMEAFMMAFDTDTAPAVGAQQTIDAANKNDSAVVTRISTLITQADIGNIDLMVKGKVGGLARGYRYIGGNQFESDALGDGFVHKDTLHAWAGAGSELTYTGLPPGCGMKAIDRDGDSFRDRDELNAGSDPANPESTPATGGVADPTPVGGERLLGGLVSRFVATPNPVRQSGTRIEFQLTRSADVTLRLFDPQGRLIRTLVDGPRDGAVSVDWDLTNQSGQRMPSGVYFYRLESGSFFETRRLTILR
ncbi:MAG TPA: FlgD immunoglobulin-like domain containing protein [Candidatus Eisenbacteria bacterium]